MSAFALLDRITIHETINPFFTGATLFLIDEAHPRRVSVEEARVAAVAGPDGKELGSLAAIGDSIAQSTLVMATMKKDAPVEGADDCTASIDLVPGCTITMDGRTRSFIKADFHLRTVSRITSAPVEHATYGTAQVATAQHDFEPLNRRMTVVMAQDDQGLPEMSVHFDDVAAARGEEADNDAAEE